MYPPKQTLTVANGGLGLIESGAVLPLVVGVTSGGTPGLYWYSDPNKLVTDLGDGPAVEIALPALDRNGGVGVLKTAASTAASSSTVTVVRTGTSTGTITLAGSARNAYRAIVSIFAAGTVGVGKFQYSLDGGYSYSEPITIPAGGSFTIPRTGITATFVAGGGPAFFDVGDVHSWTSTPAHYTTTDLGTAITTLIQNIGSRKLKQVYWAGQASSGASAATLAAVIATHMQTLATRNFFCRAIMDGGNDTAANVQTAFASFVDDRVSVVYGQADIATLNSGVVGFGVPRVPAMNAVAERVAGSSMSENAGRVASGGLRVRAITHDEAALLAFSEADRITTLRTFVGGQNAGFYVLNHYLKSALASDFKYYDWGRVIDVLCDTVIEGQNPWILAKLKSLADGTGHIDPLEAERIESMVKAGIKSTLVDPPNIEGSNGHVAAVDYNVDLNNDFLGTGIFNSTARAVPFRSIEGINTSVGFARSIA